MMKRSYSVYEAKAKFSEVIRAALTQGEVTVTQRGIPVVRITPHNAKPMDVSERLAALAAIGKVRLALKPLPFELTTADRVQVKPGAVQRFLEERD